MIETAFQYPQSTRFHLRHCRWASLKDTLVSVVMPQKKGSLFGASQIGQYPQVSGLFKQ